MDDNCHFASEKTPDNISEKSSSVSFDSSENCLIKPNKKLTWNKNRMYHLGSSDTDSTNHSQDPPYRLRYISRNGMKLAKNMVRQMLMFVNILPLQELLSYIWYFTGFTALFSESCHVIAVKGHESNVEIYDRSGSSKYWSRRQLYFSRKHRAILPQGYMTLHWKAKVVMMPTMSSLSVPEVVFMTNSGVNDDKKVGIMTIPGFQCSCQQSRAIKFSYFLQSAKANSNDNRMFVEIPSNSFPCRRWHMEAVTACLDWTPRPLFTAPLAWRYMT